MSALAAALVVATLALLMNYVVLRQLRQLEDPEYLRGEGVVIVREGAIDARSQVIGEYRGHPIWAAVTFLGMDYRFDRIVQSGERERIGPGELFIEPGLVYALK